MSLSRIALALGLVFGLTLAVVVGLQMSAEALAVVVGVVCGVAAGVPASILLYVAISRREGHQPGRAQPGADRGTYPPVVVIQGGGASNLPTGLREGAWLMPAEEQPVRRQVHIVGGDDLLPDDRRDPEE